MARIRVKDLWASAIDSTPIDMDWSAPGFSEESWRSWEVVECEECGRYVVIAGLAFEDEHRHLDEEKPTNCTGHLTAEGPMMNYYYPIPEFEGDWSPEEAVKELTDLPLAVVYIAASDTYGLALTGGGMDLSWEIAEGFVRLGYLPPQHFADLPNMAGLKLTPRRRLIIAAFRRAISIKRQRLAWDAKRLRDLRATMSQRT